MSRPIHWTTVAAVEDFLDSGYQIEVGRDARGDYEYVVTREGTEFRARLAAVGAVVS